MESGVVRIGTCSWTERSLLESGNFYPNQVKSAEHRLRFYAGHFDTVEVASSYYAIPTLQMAQAWAARTPGNFLFHVRAYGALTGHKIDAKPLTGELQELLPAADRQKDSVQVSEPAILRAMASNFVAALAPLKNARKLGFVIFQFPPWFCWKNANKDYLLYCKELVSGIPVAVEFRHGSWLTRQHADDSFAFMREHKITYITCDEPQSGNLATVPFLPETTTSMAYLRLHGRNAESRLRLLPYDYRYAEPELRSIALAVRRLSAKARLSFVMFNNCQAGHAARNALQLAGMLRKPAGTALGTARC